MLYKNNNNEKQSIQHSTQEPAIHNNAGTNDIQPELNPNTLTKTVWEPEITINEESEETTVKQVLQEEDRAQDQENETHREQEEQKRERPEEKNNKKRKRRRKIIWYNPPYNASVSTNIGKQFLKLIDKHFPPNRKDKLQKIFNWHTLKISYRTTQNMKSIINRHNSKILAEHNEQTTNQKPTCNCRNSAKAKCPLQGKCLTTSVVYKATVTTSNDTKIYIGSTEGTFKKRHYGHKSDFKHESKRHNTTLSHYIWDCKDRGEVPAVKWEIIRKCQKYRSGTRKCDVCLAEKLEILKERSEHCLNKRSELMRPCPHRRKFRLINIKDI